MNIYTKINSPCGNGNADHLSPFIDVCHANPTCPPTGPNFSDVLTNNPFSVAIHGMAQAGYISGYSDGTFRPEATATRGQVAKMLVEAFGLATSGTSTTNKAADFSDVPSTNPYYTYMRQPTKQGW